MKWLSTEIDSNRVHRPGAFWDEEKEKKKRRGGKILRSFCRRLLLLLLWMIAFAVGPGSLKKKNEPLRESIASLDNKREVFWETFHVRGDSNRPCPNGSFFTSRRFFFYLTHPREEKQGGENAQWWTADVTTHNFPKVPRLRFFCLVYERKEEE